MKFNSELKEAILLKRTINFLVEASVFKKQRKMLRCPNLGDLTGCDTLGTKIWYSNANGFHILPTWELAEVDSGYLVCVNNEMIKPIFKEAIKNNVIKELQEFHLFNGIAAYQMVKESLILLQKNSQSCYVGLEQIIKAYDNTSNFDSINNNSNNANNRNVGILTPNSPSSIKCLKNLIAAKNEGAMAILCFCVTHAGINNVSLTTNIDPNYKNLLREAIDIGVEFIAYKSSISLNEIELVAKVPLLMPQNKMLDALTSLGISKHPRIM